MRADDSSRAGHGGGVHDLFAFFGIGYGLDRWLGRRPDDDRLSMLAAVGMFFAWKARYTAQMEELEANADGMPRHEA